MAKRALHSGTGNKTFNNQAQNMPSFRFGNSIQQARICNKHLKKPGGLRHAKEDSINLGRRNAPFRGFADYMSTIEFKKDWRP